MVWACSDPFSSRKSHKEPLKADVAQVMLLHLDVQAALDSASRSAFGLRGGGRTWQGCSEWHRLCVLPDMGIKMPQHLWRKVVNKASYS